MKKLILLFLLIFLSTSVCFAQTDSFNDKADYKRINTYRKQPKLYKPAKVAIGEKAEFKLVADPGCKAYLAFSYGNSGIFYKGMDLKLSKDVEIAEAVIPSNGIYNFKLTVKDDKKMVDRALYIEAFISYPDNPNKYQKATLMDGVGHESETNQIAIIKRDTGKGFFVGPSSAFNDVMMNQYDEDSNYDPVENMQFSPDTPDYIKNMRAPQNAR